MTGAQFPAPTVLAEVSEALKVAADGAAEDGAAR